MILIKEKLRMKENKLIYLNLFIISAVIICFEIVSTRISSVIFVNNYAFMILSLAILGLGSGGIFAYYKINSKENIARPKVIPAVLLLLGFSLSIFMKSNVQINSK